NLGDNLNKLKGGILINTRLTNFWKITVILFTIVGVLMSINQLFFLNFLGFSPVTEGYLYYLLALFVPLSFIFYPVTKNSNHSKMPWYDIVLFLAAFLIPLYFAINAQDIILVGWEYNAPTIAVYMSIVYWVIILEALRRSSGLVLPIFCLVFSLYPLISDMVPISFLSGQSYDFVSTATSHVFGSDSLIGVPFKTVGNLLIGFLVFGVVVVHTGGGDFFCKIEESLFGKTRGGTAKVSVVGSAFFGMLSGSAVSNTITTGAMTIPSMKKSGFKKEYAAAIESTASTVG